MIKGVIFDVDGTLLDTEWIYIRAWQQAAKKAGYDLPVEVLLKTRAINKDLAERIYKEAMGEDFCYTELFGERVRIAERMIAETEDLLKPGVADTLRWLKDRGIPMAVASSTNLEKTRLHLEHAGLLSYFDAVVGGDMVQKGKPEPDIFLLAAAKLKLRPEVCAVIEDSPAGIQAAYRAKTRPVLIPDCVPENPQTREMSAAVLGSMEQLIPFLEKYL